MSAGAASSSAPPAPNRSSASWPRAGLDYVKLEAALSLGIAGDTSRTCFVRGLVGTLQSLGMQVMAEGLVEAADVQALWACGVDGVTGPAVAMRSAAVATAA